MSSDYPTFAKIPRLHRDVVITEKIDGTNALVSIRSLDGDLPLVDGETGAIEWGGGMVGVRAGSRKRWITPDDDNATFAGWVAKNAQGLAQLGPGNHYGEWWGQGIQRGYGLKEKRLSLFNTKRWSEDDLPSVPGLHVVPVLYTGPLFHDNEYYNCSAAVEMLERLKHQGSHAAPGFMRPEGIMVYHTAAGAYFKATINGDEKPKTQADAVLAG